MKKAVIVVGRHFAGKSKTLRGYVKPKLEIDVDKHQFTRNGQSGFVLVQTCEEAETDVKERVKKYSGYDLLVLAARPANESLSHLAELEVKLKNAGYRVRIVNIVKPQNADDNDEYYGGKADEIIGYLDDLGASAASA